MNASNDCWYKNIRTKEVFSTVIHLKDLSAAKAYSIILRYLVLGLITFLGNFFISWHVAGIISLIKW